MTSCFWYLHYVDLSNKLLYFKVTMSYFLKTSSYCNNGVYNYDVHFLEYSYGQFSLQTDSWYKICSQLISNIISQWPWRNNFPFHIRCKKKVSMFLRVRKSVASLQSSSKYIFLYVSHLHCYALYRPYIW